jgi:ribosomal protein L15
MCEDLGSTVRKQRKRKKKGRRKEGDKEGRNGGRGREGERERKRETDRGREKGKDPYIWAYSKYFMCIICTVKCKAGYIFILRFVP